MVSAASNRTLWVAGSAMLAFGTLIAAMKDWQVMLGFKQPCMWTTGTFFAQCFLFPVHFCSERRASDGGDRSKQAKPPAPFHVYVLVTTFAFSSMLLLNVAYSGLPGSICQMLKGLKLVMTCILSCTVLGKTLRGHQYFGVSLTVAGLALVGVATISGEGTGWASPRDTFVSLNYGILSMLIGAMQFVWEEKTMKQYAVDAALLTAMKGIVGIFYGIIMLAVSDALHIVNVPGALAELFNRKNVMIAFILMNFAQGVFGFVALVVTSHSSAMVRSLLDEARAACVWITEVYCGWERFLWVELGGYGILVMGVMIYGKHLKVPCLAYEEEKPLLPVKQEETQK